jgi:hypothetical protein
MHILRRLSVPRTTCGALGLWLAACSPGAMDVVTLAPNTLRLGMVAHWSCDETGEGPLVDHSGNGHDGTLFGPTWIEGKFGGGLHFDSGNWVNVPSFPQATSNWSVALWYRAPAGDFGDSYLTLASNQQLFVGGWEIDTRLSSVAGSQYRFSYPLGGDATSGAVHVESQPVDVDSWVHLAAVVDADARQLSLFKNGETVTSLVLPATIRPGTDNLYIGRWTDVHRFLVGDLDDVAIFNRALTLAEVRALATAPAPEQQ